MTNQDDNISYYYLDGRTGNPKRVSSYQDENILEFLSRLTGLDADDLDVYAATWSKTNISARDPLGNEYHLVDDGTYS